MITHLVPLMTKRLRWSRGSMLAFGTQVRGFAPGQSRWIFRAKKILSTPSFGGEVKPSVPYRSFTACERSLNVTWRSEFRQNLPDISRPQFHLSSLGALAWRRLVAKVGTSNPDRTISLKSRQCVFENKPPWLVLLKGGEIMCLADWLLPSHFCFFSSAKLYLSLNYVDSFYALGTETLLNVVWYILCF
jgi:hypothetical protein